MNKLLTVGVVVAVVFAGLAFFGVSDGVDGKDGFSAQPGPDHYDVQLFHAGQVDGGMYVATTSSGAGTLTASQLANRQGYTRYLDVNATDAVTLTFPATSTLTGFIPSVGDCANIMLENSGDSNLTLAAGTGMDLQEPDGQNVVIGTTNYAKLTFCRTNSSDMVLWADESIPAD